MYFHPSKVVAIKLYWDGVVVMGRPGVIASSCVVVSFPLYLSSEPCRYVIGPSEVEIVGCKDPVIVCASCVPKVRHDENLVLM